MLDKLQQIKQTQDINIFGMLITMYQKRRMYPMPQKKHWLLVMENMF